MIPDRLLTVEGQIVSKSQTGTEDAFGTPTITETTSDVTIAQLQPMTAEEIPDRAAGRSVYRTWAKGIGSVESFDELVLASGQIWEIIGPPLVWTNPRTGAIYYELQLAAYEDEDFSL